MATFPSAAQPRIDTTRIEIPLAVQESWQKSVDLIAKIAQIPAALVMRVHLKEIEVFVSSHSGGNPYEAGEKANLQSGLYCETVMANRERLLVPNALADPNWDHNPDIKLNMISYMGWPITWPNGDNFGTICILDAKPNAYDETKSALLYQFKELIEFSLRSIYEQILLEAAQDDAQHLDDERRRYKQLAAIDSLTRLYNRRAFLDIAAELFERARQDRTPIAVLMIDVDHFKSINDRYGHHIGDKALVETSRLLTKLSRRVDILSRFGGDEFILMAPGVAGDATVALAERIVEAARANPISVLGVIPLTLSVGLYSCVPADETIETAIRRADQALLGAKAQGRDRALCWNALSPGGGVIGADLP